MIIKRWYNNLKLRTKLAISLLAVVIFMVIVAFVGIYSVNTLDTEYEEMYQRYGEGISYIGDIGVAHNQSHADSIILVLANSAFLVAEEVDFDEVTTGIYQLNNSAERNFANYKGLITDPDEMAKAEILEQKLIEYRLGQEEVIQLFDDGRATSAYDLLFGDVSTIHAEINVLVEDTMNDDVNIARSKMEELTEHKNLFLTMINVTSGVAIVFAILSIFILTVSLAGRVNKLLKITERVAAGDTNIDIDENLYTKDEIGQLAIANGEMVEAIRNQVEVAQKIAGGDLSVTCEVRSENDILAISINMIVDQLQKVMAEFEYLGQASVEGRLDARGDTSEFKGQYKDIVVGLHGSLDAFREPLMYVSAFLEEIAAGTPEENLPTSDSEFVGDYKILVDSLYAVTDTITAVYNEINKLNEASEEGNLRVRGDADLVPGSYKDMIEGINGIMDKTLAPLMEASRVLGRVSTGDLTTKVQGDYRGDYAIIKKSLNHTIDSMSVLINDMGVAADQVAAGANQISDSSILLSEGTTEQASSIEQLTASTEQIAAQTRLNADHAENVNKLSQRSKDHALHSNVKMDELLVAMDDINASSNNISAVIKVIEDIAFQTNILALNAAVEAARAGQHGRGFAVVAEEVKNLAERSAKAANETTAMIEDSIMKSEGGKKIADESARDLESVVTDIEEIAELIHSITTASREQAIGIEQINQGILQVSEVVETNSATSEETAAASEELSSQAEVLREEVNKFTIGEAQGEGYGAERLNADIDRMLKRMEKKTQLEAQEQEEALKAEKESKEESKKELKDHEKADSKGELKEELKDDDKVEVKEELKDHDKAKVKEDDKPEPVKKSKSEKKAKKDSKKDTKSDSKKAKKSTKAKNKKSKATINLDDSDFGKY